MSDYQQSRALAKSLHTALSGDIGVTNLLGNPARLYDHAPEDPVYPYLTYGPMRSEDKGGDDAPLTTHSLSLHVWSRYEGRAEILKCLSAVTGVIEGGTIAMSGGKIIRANVLYTDNFRAADGRTLHGLLRLSITTEPT